MMEVRVHRITSISCLFSSISFRFSLERCMKHTATRHAWHFFSTSKCDLCFFVGGGFSTLLTCALCLLGSSVIDQCSSLRHDCLIKMQRAETRRSWEERASAHQWEQRASASDAGEALGELLVLLHVQCVSCAKQFSILCWWAAKAGAVGPVNAYALGQNPQTG